LSQYLAVARWTMPRKLLASWSYRVSTRGSRSHPHPQMSGPAESGRSQAGRNRRGRLSDHPFCDETRLPAIRSLPSGREANRRGGQCANRVRRCGTPLLHSDVSEEDARCQGTPRRPRACAGGERGLDQTTGATSANRQMLPVPPFIIIQAGARNFALSAAISSARRPRPCFT